MALPSGHRGNGPGPNACAARGIAAALQELASGTPGPTGDEALAEREQRHIEVEARAHAQGALPLRGGH